MKLKKTPKPQKAVFIAYVPKNMPFKHILVWETYNKLTYLSIADSMWKTRATKKHYLGAEKESLPEYKVRITLELLS
jgi:hypothetical protein